MFLGERAPVRGNVNVNPKFNDFLWTAINSIWGAQTRGAYATALKLLAMLISWTPPSIRDDFTQRADRIIKTLDMVASGNLSIMDEINDPNLLQLYKIELMDTYSSEALQDVVEELGDALQKGNYIEFTRFSPTATSSASD